MLRCRLVWLLLLVGVVLSAQGTRIGGFLVEIDAGWTPVNAEAREGRLGAQFRRAEADGLSTLVFSPHKATFRTEDERRQILHEFEQRMRAEHPNGFATGSYRLGGSEAPYVRYNHGGKSYLLLQPNDANTVYTVLVELPGENREAPASVAAVLSSIRLGGTPSRSGWGDVVDVVRKAEGIGRGTSKDMATKLFPLMNSTQAASAAGAQAMRQSQQHWRKINGVLDSFGKGDLDPVTASRKIRELTGGKSIAEVTEDMATLLESLGKRVGR